MTRPPAAAAFADRVVLVTGASSGVGAALARAFAVEGADVVLFARSEADLDTLTRAVLRAVRARKRRVFVPGWIRLLPLLAEVAPDLADRVIEDRMAREGRGAGRR